MGLLDRAKLSIDWKALNPFNRTLLTLGIEGGSVRLLASEGRTVLGWLSTPFNPRMVSDGRIDDPNGLAKVVGNAVARLGVNPGSVVAAFPSSRVTARVLSLPDVGGMRPSTLVPREARRIMGSAVDYHYISWTSLGKVGLEQRYYLVAAPKAEMLSFLQTLSMTSLRAKKVDSRALALARGVGEPTAIIMNVETYGLDIVVVLDHIPISVAHRELPIGLGVEDLVDEVTDEYQVSTEHYGDRNPSQPIPPNVPTYLTGGHPFVNAKFAQVLSNGLRRNLLFPTPPMDYPEDFPVLAYVINVGLALKSP